MLSLDNNNQLIIRRFDVLLKCHPIVMCSRYPHTALASRGVKAPFNNGLDFSRAFDLRHHNAVTSDVQSFFDPHLLVLRYTNQAWTPPADGLNHHLSVNEVRRGMFCFNPQNMAITDADLPRASVVGGGSVYPAVQNAMLACRAENLGVTLTTLLCFEEDAVRELLNIPDPWYTCAFMPIGYPVGKGHGPITRRPVAKLAYLDGWGNEF